MGLSRRKPKKVPDLDIRLLTPADRDWVRRRIIETWGSETVVVHQTVYRPAELPGFIAKSGDEIIGLLTYHLEGEACEIVTLDAWRTGLGVGIALIETVKQAAGREKCRRLWLVTTNDNLPALASTRSAASSSPPSTSTRLKKTAA
jgi:ribosomal protein S18 acetylase RimI-like enzyme